MKRFQGRTGCLTADRGCSELAVKIILDDPNFHVKKQVRASFPDIFSFNDHVLSRVLIQDVKSFTFWLATTFLMGSSRYLKKKLRLCHVRWSKKQDFINSIHIGISYISFECKLF